MRRVLAIPQSLAKLMRDALPPTESNVDPLLHAYKFWKDVESVAKKQKDLALKDILTDFPMNDPEDVIIGEYYTLEYKFSQRMIFDAERFKLNIVNRYPKVKLMVLDDLQQESKSASPFRTYKVKDNL
jgi:hypothetical protein